MNQWLYPHDLPFPWTSNIRTWGHPPTETRYYRQ
jgi:hypothetical protein